MQIRKLVTIVEETLAEAGGTVGPPGRVVAVAAVIRNPLAGRHGDNLAELVTTGEELGKVLANRVAQLLAGAGGESYGKGAIVGQEGEFEHAAALIGPRFGVTVEPAIGGAKAVIPSPKKMGTPGTSIGIPLRPSALAAPISSGLAAGYVMEVRVPGHPREDEIVVVLAVVEGGRTRA